MNIQEYDGGKNIDLKLNRNNFLIKDKQLFWNEFVI